MKNKKKGFTLVELLATIIVLAVLSLIVVPIIISIIDNARTSAFKRSVESINKISSNYYIDKSNKIKKLGQISFDCNNDECESIITNENGNKETYNLKATGNMGNGYVKIYDNGNVEFLLSNGKLCATKYPDKDNINYYKGTCKEIIIDLDKIKIDNIETFSTTHSILVKVEASAGESGIGKYVFAIDGEVKAEIKSTDTSYEYLFDGLSEKKHQIKVSVYNGTYDKPNYDKSIGMDEKEIEASLLDFGDIAITSSSTDWKTSKTYAITSADETTQLQYKIELGDELKQDWIDYSNELTVNWQSTSLIPTNICARLYDGTNTSEEICYTETKIDTTAPSTPKVVKGIYMDWTVIDDLSKWHNKTVYFPQIGKNGEVLVSGAEDNESGIARYEISADNKTWYDLSKYDSSSVYNTSTSAKRYYRAINNVGLASFATEVDVKIDTTSPTVSYSLAEGTYNTYQTIRITPSDDNYSYMRISVYKNSALVYSGMVEEKSTNKTSDPYYDVTLDSDGAWTIYTQVYDKAGNMQNQNPNNGSWYYQTYTIDTTGPIVTLTKGEVTTKEITVVANATDNESGIKGYEFSIDNGVTWKPYQTSKIYKFENLKRGTYNIKVKAYNNVNLSTISEPLSVSTLELNRPTFTISPDGWVASKTVTITYPTTALIKQYSIDGGKTWNNYNNAITFTSSGSIVAKASDGVNESINTTNIYIDKTTPVASITVFNGNGVQIENGGTIGLNSTSTIRFSCKAGESGVEEYQYSSIHDVTYQPSIESKIIKANNNNIYEYKIVPNNLKNSFGKSITSGTTIHHNLICKSAAGYISNVATFDTKIVDDSLTVSLEKTSSTINSITVLANASSKVGIAKYEFKIDSDSWIDNGTSNKYTFDGLSESSTHTIYTRVTNNTGIVVEKNISATTSSSVTCETYGGCTCSSGSLSGSVALVCKDLNGTVVSSETVYSCNGCCGPNCSGGGGSSSSCSCSATVDELHCYMYNEREDCSIESASAMLKSCYAQGVDCTS